MPRASTGATSTEPTREWRKRLKVERRPETDAVDTALAAAVTVYSYTAATSASDRDRRRASALELMAINYLVARGYAHDQAERQVCRRVRRLGVEKLIPMVNGASSTISR